MPSFEVCSSSASRTSVVGEVAEKVNVPLASFGSVAVIDGLVYASHPAAGGQRLSAYKVSNGEQVWSREVGSELLVTPVIAGDSIYVSTLGGQTYRFDHRTGKQRWSKPLKATTAPWVAGSELYVSRRKGGKEQQIVVSTETGEVLREHHVSAGSYTNDVPTHLGDWKMVWAFEGSRPVVDRGIRLSQRLVEHREVRVERRDRGVRRGWRAACRRR